MRETLKEETDTKKSFIELSNSSKANVKDLIEQFSKDKETKETIIIIGELFRTIMADTGLEFSDLGMSYENETNVDFNRPRPIMINPDSIDKKMKEEQFVYNKCRYAGYQKTCIVKNEYYENLYRLFELIRNIYIYRMKLLAKNNDKLGMYYSDVIYDITERDLLHSKKMAKLTENDKQLLAFYRYANIYAAKNLCEIFKEETKNTPLGCLNMQSYIMLSEYLKKGYGNAKLIGSSKTMSPLEKLCKVSGISYDKYKGLDLSFEQRIMHGFDVTESELAYLNNFIFDESQGKPKTDYETLDKSLKISNIKND